MDKEYTISPKIPCFKLILYNVDKKYTSTRKIVLFNYQKSVDFLGIKI